MTRPPYPPPGPYPPGRFPAPPKQNNALIIILGVLGGIVLLCGFGGCAVLLSAGDSDDGTTATFSRAPSRPGATSAVTRTSPSTGARTPAVQPSGQSDIATPGAVVRDGKFEFQVTAVDPPVKVLGENEFWEETAQGLYIQVHVTITNIGDKPKTYWSSNQKLIDDRGREFENDTMAGFNVNDGTAMSSAINPGNHIDVVIVFDVPPGTVPAYLELHDSAFSGGAKVALR